MHASLKRRITADALMFLESATEIQLGLDSKWGLSKRQHACEYSKACREVYRSAKVVRSPFTYEFRIVLITLLLR
jgi:hypothetical protein